MLNTVKKMLEERVVSLKPKDLELTQIGRIMRDGNPAMVRWPLFSSAESRASLHGQRVVIFYHSVMSTEGWSGSYLDEYHPTNGLYSPSY